MKVSIKETLAKITDQLNFVPQVRTWSNIATPSAAYYTCATFQLKPKSKYLILAYMSNGLGTAATNVCGLGTTAGTPIQAVYGIGQSNAGSGNATTGWGYVETGSSEITVVVRGYGYNTSAKLAGTAVAIRLVGGGTA